MFCIKCGAKLPEGSRFCSMCGASVPNVDHQKRAAVPVRHPKTKKVKKYTALTIVLIVILVLASAALVGLLFMKNWSGWLELSGNSYYLYHGEKVIGLSDIDGNQYYFNGDGIMQTGWQDFDGSRRYFSDTGVMQTGWQVIGNDTYYFDKKGVMQTGWQPVDGNSYYFDSGGVMQTGWLELEGNRYYLNDDGSRSDGWKTIDGKKYYFSHQGILHIGWLNQDNQTYYCSGSDNGAVATGKWVIDSQQYYFDSDGIMTTGAVELMPNNVYHFDENGRFLYNDITMTEIPSTASDTQVTFKNRGGGDTYSHARIFEEPIENVLSIQCSISIVELDYGNCDGQWQVHVRTLNGQWKRIGYFTVSNSEGSFNIAFDEPLSFDAYVCTCYESTSWSGSFIQAVDSIVVRYFDFGSDIQTEYL